MPTLNCTKQFRQDFNKFLASIKRLNNQQQTREDWIFLSHQSNSAQLCFSQSHLNLEDFIRQGHGEQGGEFRNAAATIASVATVPTVATTAQETMKEASRIFGPERADLPGSEALRNRTAGVGISYEEHWKKPLKPLENRLEPFEETIGTIPKTR